MDVFSMLHSVPLSSTHEPPGCKYPIVGLTLYLLGAVVLTLYPTSLSVLFFNRKHWETGAFGSVTSELWVRPNQRIANPWIWVHWDARPAFWSSTGSNPKKLHCWGTHNLKEFGPLLLVDWFGAWNGVTIKSSLYEHVPNTTLLIRNVRRLRLAKCTFHSRASQGSCKDLIPTRKMFVRCAGVPPHLMTLFFTHVLYLPFHSAEDPGDCKGSIRYVHQQCLQDWLGHSRSKKCEVCSREYAFKPSMYALYVFWVEQIHWQFLIYCLPFTNVLSDQWAFLQAKDKLLKVRLQDFLWFCVFLFNCSLRLTIASLCFQRSSCFEPFRSLIWVAFSVPQKGCQSNETIDLCLLLALPCTIHDLSNLVHFLLEGDDVGGRVCFVEEFRSNFLVLWHTILYWWTLGGARLCLGLYLWDFWALCLWLTL